MARRTKRRQRPKGRTNVIKDMIEMYDIRTAEDIQEALKDLLGETLEVMLEEEMNEHLGYEKYQRSDTPNYRNGIKSKKIRSSYYYQLNARAREDQYGQLRIEIIRLFNENKGRYGYRRIHALLKRNGITVTEKIVRRIMKEAS